MQIEPIQQRPRDLCPITHHLCRRALALDIGMTTVTTWAWVHGGHDLKSRWKSDLSRRPADGDFASFHGLPQHFQDPPFKLRQFIQKQHTPVRQRDLTRARTAATVIYCNK